MLIGYCEIATVMGVEDGKTVTKSDNGDDKIFFSITKRNSALKTLLEKGREEAAEDLDVDETARELIADQTHRLRNTHALR